ncbi:hypothetical protein [Spirilliplanes yamanashiensis]|uniref:DUF3592 domain-containing protein n=1 Tax=Spirilliplanes yamanashiensis TaxID=42233 RepID=A0A8J3YCH0_9ACTN|nr:hypothetical protein [Spirilliplanes yamanashiensis]MDP9818910.1 hypothetical protein [Spirilliplanes yamanashiensis]GIJ05364.1 hypothetical protein Sya03_47160 [Spirilliplanes yamanashiensis]
MSSFLDRVVPFCWFLIGICVIGLGSEVVGIVQQIPVQRGIDANTVRLPGIFTELDKRGKLHDDKHYVSYVYQDRSFSTPLRGIPGNPDVGAMVCVEIDATRPENMRPCDTRGGLGDSLSGLIWGGGFLAVALLGLWARNEFAWGFDWRREYRRPDRPHPSTLRRTPTRRDRKRARKARREADEEFSGW